MRTMKDIEKALGKNLISVEKQQNGRYIARGFYLKIRYSVGKQTRKSALEELYKLLIINGFKK